MNSIEEKLWAYIDGICSDEEQKAISLLIMQDEAYRQKYQELLTLTQELETMELEEPSMAFTYNVMETIRADYAQKPLKASVDQRVIKGIASFFLLTILALLTLIIVNINWSVGNVAAPVALKLPDLKHLLNGPILKGFLFFDVVLVLFLLDTFLRKKGFSKQT